MAPIGVDEVEPTEIQSVEPATLVFLLGELPFVTARYRGARANLDDDENLSIDGMKALLLATHNHYKATSNHAPAPSRPSGCPSIFNMCGICRSSNGG